MADLPNFAIQKLCAEEPKNLHTGTMVETAFFAHRVVVDFIHLQQLHILRKDALGWATGHHCDDVAS
jgi:hypothetical protein